MCSSDLDAPGSSLLRKQNCKVGLRPAPLTVKRMDDATLLPPTVKTNLPLAKISTPKIPFSPLVTSCLLNELLEAVGVASDSQTVRSIWNKSLFWKTVDFCELQCSGCLQRVLGLPRGFFPSSQRDMPRTPHQGGVQEASLSDARATSTGSSQPISKGEPRHPAGNSF